MNKKFKKKELIEASLTMDTDTFNKVRGTLDDKDKVRVVAKGALDKPTSSSISEDDSDESKNKQIITGRDIKIGNILTGKKPWQKVVDLDSNNGAWLIVTVEDMETGRQQKFKFFYDKKYYVLPLPQIDEDLEKDSRAVEYGYDPELDGDSWEDFLNALDQENIEHQKKEDSLGNVNEVTLKKSDLDKIKKNK